MIVLADGRTIQILALCCLLFIFAVIILFGQWPDAALLFTLLLSGVIAGALGGRKIGRKTT